MTWAIQIWIWKVKIEWNAAQNTLQFCRFQITRIPIHILFEKWNIVNNQLHKRYGLILFYERQNVHSLIRITKPKIREKLQKSFFDNSFLKIKKECQFCNYTHRVTRVKHESNQGLKRDLSEGVRALILITISIRIFGFQSWRSCSCRWWCCVDHNMVSFSFSSFPFIIIIITSLIHRLLPWTSISIFNRLGFPELNP